jgi:outer membrane lipoprotein SlyB
MAGTGAMLRHLLTLAALAGVVTCAPVNPPPQPVQPEAADYGTILSMRPIQRRAAAEPLRAALLSDAGAAEGGNAARVEFIVRAAGGATLSIVQANDADFHPGDRVTILRGAETRLARPN